MKSIKYYIMNISNGIFKNNITVMFFITLLVLFTSLFIMDLRKENDIKTVTERLDKINSDITKIKTTIKSLKSDVDNVKSDLETVESELDELKSELEDIGFNL